MKTFYFLALAALLLFSGCRKESPQPTNKLIGSWLRVKVEYKDAENIWQDVHLPCLTADTEEYRANGVWFVAIGDSPCGPGTDTHEGKWRLEADGTKIIYSNNAASGEFEATVEVLTDNQLVLIRNVNSAGPQQHRTTYQRK